MERKSRFHFERRLDRKRITGLRWIVSLSLLGLALLGCGPTAQSQAAPAGIGPGARFTVGAMYSNYQADYGKRYLGGISGFFDYARSDKLSYEFEGRYLFTNEEFGTHQSTYLVGPRYTWRFRHAAAYGKLLIGEGKFHFPYDYADGNYFVVAAGGGVDVPIRQSRYMIRLVDFEYQSWTNFPFGTLHPYGISTGVAVRFH